MSLLKKVQEIRNKAKPELLRVFKTESHNTVTFVALEPGVEDYNGDIITADETVKAAHTFMLDLANRKVNVNHEADTDLDDEDARFVESYILPVDLWFWEEKVKKGAWLIAIKFSDEVFKQILDGDIVGISIEWTYYKEEIT